MKKGLITLSFLFVAAYCLNINAQAVTEVLSPQVVKCRKDINGIKGLSFVEVKNYSFDSFNRVVNAVLEQQFSQKAPACTQVRRGDFVVRNLDWFQYDEGTVIVRLDANKDSGTLGSLQVCGGLANISHDTDVSQLSGQLIYALLGGFNDGMNTEGIYVGVNVVPYGEMATDGTGGNVDYMSEGGKNQYSLGILPRLILDNAKSLEDAKKIILDNGWKDFEPVTAAGFQLHWLVASKEGTFVCEFINGRPVFVDAASTISKDLGNIMVNFSNYLDINTGTIQPHGMGYERVKVVEDNYNGMTNLDACKKMAKKLFYSKMYSEPLTAPDYFWTEWALEHDDKGTMVPGGTKTLLKFRDNPKSRSGVEWEVFQSIYKYETKAWDWRIRGYSNQSEPATNPWWFTSHSSIWNLATKTLIIDFEEQGTFKTTYQVESEERRQLSPNDDGLVSQSDPFAEREKKGT